MQTNADGSSVIVQADGTRVKKRADGGVHEIQHTDGSVVHKGADGAVTTTKVRAQCREVQCRGAVP